MADRFIEELGYVAGLLREKGDANVPRCSIESYLRCQVVEARKAEETKVQMAFEFAAELVRWENYEGARAVVLYAIRERETT